MKMRSVGLEEITEYDVSEEKGYLLSVKLATYIATLVLLSTAEGIRDNEEKTIEAGLEGLSLLNDLMAQTIKDIIHYNFEKRRERNANH